MKGFLEILREIRSMAGVPVKNVLAWAHLVALLIILIVVLS